MSEHDVIVVGGGLAGLMAAAAAAGRGNKVLVVTQGVGTVAIGGGTIDVLGYNADGRPVGAPAAGLVELPADHPYTIIGRPGLDAALAFFGELTRREGYPYSGSLAGNQWLPTAVGTLKPSCLTPRTMDGTLLDAADEVLIAGFAGLKDYYPELVARGLRKNLSSRKVYRTALLDPGPAEGRDLTALDIARWLDGEPGRQDCLEQLKQAACPGTLVIMPPVLGTRPDCRVLEEFEQATGCRFLETAGLPPAVTGLRLHSLLIGTLKRQGVRFIEQATVAGAVVEQGRCRAVLTQSLDRERVYPAKAFILATGGFFGGGITPAVGKALEPIFNLPVAVPARQEEWGNETLFSGGAQPFGKFGIAVDEALRPVDTVGNVLVENLHIAGRNLAGYDYCSEKSGNGVAVASGYHAGMSA